MLSDTYGNGASSSLFVWPPMRRIPRRGTLEKMFKSSSGGNRPVIQCELISPLTILTTSNASRSMERNWNTRR